MHNSLAQWVDQQFLPGELYQVSFVTPNIGFVAGSNYLFATTDGGLHWTTRQSASQIYFLNRSTGLASTYYVNRTTNGGTTWYQTTAPFYGSEYQSFSFIDSLSGWVVGNGGRIMKTTDGGENWELQQSGTAENLFSV